MDETGLKSTIWVFMKSCLTLNKDEFSSPISSSFDVFSTKFVSILEDYFSITLAMLELTSVVES